MTGRRVLVAVVAMVGLTAWLVGRPGNHARAQGIDPLDVVTVADTDVGGGTYDENAQRYRANQSRHWRQMAIGHK